MLENWKTCGNIKVAIVPVVIGAFGTVTKVLLKALEDLEVGGRVETNPNYYIIENGQNTEKSPGDLTRLAVSQTPVERPSANSDVKKLYWVNNNKKNNNSKCCSLIMMVSDDTSRYSSRNNMEK